MLTSKHNFPFSYSKLDPYIKHTTSCNMNNLWRMPSIEKLYPNHKTTTHNYSFTKFEFQEKNHNSSPIYDLPPFENNKPSLKSLNFKTTSVLDPKQLGKQFLRQRARSFEKSQARGREIYEIHEKTKRRSRSNSAGRRKYKSGESMRE